MLVIILVARTCENNYVTNYFLFLQQLRSMLYLWSWTNCNLSKTFVIDCSRLFRVLDARSGLNYYKCLVIKGKMLNTPGNTPTLKIHNLRLDIFISQGTGCYGSLAQLHPEELIPLQMHLALFVQFKAPEGLSLVACLVGGAMGCERVDWIFSSCLQTTFSCGPIAFWNWLFVAVNIAVILFAGIEAILPETHQNYSHVPLIKVHFRFVE